MSDNGGKKSMQHTRLVKCALGAGLVLSFGIFGKYMVSSSTTMGSETELAGMAYMLDQYCTIQVGATQSNISTPRITPSIKSIGSPTPIRYLTLSSGKYFVVYSISLYKTSFVSPTAVPPIL